MAEVVIGAMGTLLPKLSEMLTKEYNLQRRVRGEIMFLKAEMESMETALLKISEAPIDQPPDIQVKLWAKAVRDLSYDLEDSIDKFIVRIETHEPEKSHSFRNFIDKSLSLLTKGKIRHKIGIDIKDIKNRIKEVSERRDRYKVDSVATAKSAGPSVDTLRLSALYTKAMELVGTDEKSLEVVKMLMEGDEVSKKQLKVVSIAGFGGLGKTTLANAVYEKLKVHFDFTAFVSVSLNPNMEKIFKSLLHQLHKQKYENINEATWGEAQLISEIRTFLENKRYLIVIDDLWDKSVWENIKYSLTANEHASRVITTTRILNIAEQAGDVYRLEPLSVVDSRKLFHQRIYETENKSPPNQLFEISEKILKRCGGVPLAIITIGSLLSSKTERAHTHEYWSKVYKSLGLGLDNGHADVKNMRRILSVSYSDLPPHLKTCILHLSLYPEDYEIQTERLIWKWVGEGFVKKEHGRSLYEVGEDYFDQLINKSLVQPVKIDNGNKVHSCRVHDMVRDLITSLSNEENFLTIVGSQQPVYLPSKIRRLSVQTNIEEVANQLPTMSLSYVRSLTVSSLAFSLLPALSGFPILRVLDLTDCKQVDNNHWKDICSLFHLRYLSLKGTSITKIPKGIGNLQFLEVLDIRSTEIEEKLPSTIIQLTHLLLLHMLDSMTCAVPRWICSMCSLFSLSITLELGEEDLQVLGSIPSLSELHIQVKKPTQGRDKRLVIDGRYPFQCLKRFRVESETMELRFAWGAMQSLRTLRLEFKDVPNSLVQFGAPVFGLENLSSLEHINVEFRNGEDGNKIRNVRNAVKREIYMNRNKPKLDFPRTTGEIVESMGRLRKCFGKGIPIGCSEEAGDSDGVSFVPNDFAEDNSYPFSEDGEMDDPEFDKALYDFYVSHKVNRLKRKLSCAAARNVKLKRSSDFPAASTFTRYSGKLFSSCIAGLSPRQVRVIQSYGADCLLKFVRTEVPLRFVKWLASKFDVHASEIQVRKNFIPVTKYVIHDILDLLVDGEPIFSDAEAGREFILSHFNVTSIPPVSFFTSKLKSTTEELTDEDIFICFMCIAFSTFLCPNSSLSPSPKYLHIFRDCSSVMNYDLSRFVYECLLSSIKKFKDSTKVASKRSVTFGGCHYALAVSYLDHVHFGLNSLPDIKPRILVWRGNKVKHFSELDKNNSRSYGKRPLKHLSPSLYAPKSCEKFSCSGGHTAATSNIPFANKISTSEVNAPAGSNMSFACKVETAYASRFGNEVVKQIIGLVQKSNADKPQIFQDWSESLVFNVLGCVGDSSFKSPVGSHAESPLDNKADSPTFKISSSDNLSGCKSVPIESTKKASDDPSVSKTPENVLSDECTKDGLNFPPPGPVTAPTAPVTAPVPASDVRPVVSCNPEDFSKGSSPSTSMLAMLVAMPTSIPLGSPLKRCKPNVDVISHGRPSMALFKHDCESKIARSVTKADQNIGSADVDFEFHPATNNLSPLIPIRLSQRFIDEVDKVQCSQYVSERLHNSPESPFEQDCVLMVTLSYSNISKSVQSSNLNYVDLGSPEALNEFFNGGDDVIGLDEVQIVGTSTFSDRCVNFTKKTNEAYNQLNNLASSSSFRPGVANSPEVLIISDPEGVAKLKAVHQRNVPVISKVFDCSIATTQHVPRRIVGAARFNSDPYVQQLNRFPVTLQERKHYFAMNRIGTHDVWCKYEAIRYDRAFCSYRSLASLCPNGHLDNFLILCFCRFLFNKCHPSKSKKHFFFSYVGECILNNNNPKTRNPDIVRNAFEGACIAFLLWRSNFLYFPIGLDGHWFSFVVCMKDRAFVFLDSAFGENSTYHQDIRDELIHNFIGLWDAYVTPIMHKRINFEEFDVLYPAVPKQDNRHDCGVFTFKYMEIFTPRTQMANLFSSVDIPNLRIKYANDMYFSPLNS